MHILRQAGDIAGNGGELFGLRRCLAQALQFDGLDLQRESFGSEVNVANVPQQRRDHGTEELHAIGQDGLLPKALSPCSLNAQPLALNQEGLDGHTG